MAFSRRQLQTTPKYALASHAASRRWISCMPAIAMCGDMSPMGATPDDRRRLLLSAMLTGPIVSDHPHLKIISRAT